MDKITGGNITGVVNNPEVAKIQDSILVNIINPILTIATSVSFALFVFGMFRFLINRTTNPDEVQKGKAHMLWGIVGLFILLSIWSIFIFIGNIFDSKVWFVN
ncbi:MAG: hypothetical protein QG614_543 [Patescibacteria group bacterium]|nr:hypothetical protein [Patescibacteria group bacterium]